MLYVNTDFGRRNYITLEEYCLGWFFYLQSPTVLWLQRYHNVTTYAYSVSQVILAVAVTDAAEDIRVHQERPAAIAMNRFKQDIIIFWFNTLPRLVVFAETVNRLYHLQAMLYLTCDLELLSGTIKIILLIPLYIIISIGYIILCTPNFRYLNKLSERTRYGCRFI